MIALLPVSVLEQTQSPILKQEGSLFGTCPCQSLLISVNSSCSSLQYSSTLFYIFQYLKFIDESRHMWACAWLLALGSSVGGNGEGSWVPRRGTEQGVTGMLPPTLPARLETSEGQEQMHGFGGGLGGREVRRERKQSKGNKIRTALHQCAISLQHKTNLPQVFLWTWQLCK